MSSTETRPFTAATNKFAYAQVFTRSSLHPYDDAPVRTGRTERRLHLPTLHRGKRSKV